MTVLGPRPPVISIGFSDYRVLRQSDYTYVDKTSFVVGVLDSPVAAAVYPRPRRFGKTLNLSTLRYFLERSDEDLTGIFEDTEVWKVQRCREHFQRYPVVYLTFKDVKADNWASASKLIVSLLREEAERLLDKFGLRMAARPFPWSQGSSNLDDYQPLLRDLSGLCEEAVGERIVLLIDEYDAPLHAAWRHGYWTQAVSFFRAFLSGGLKDNAALFRGAMTGILRVAKEGIFSGLNNVEVRSILHSRQATDFGFRPDEVDELAQTTGQSATLEGLREWYDGYQFGQPESKTVYNPWSVLRYLSNPEAGLQSFWKNSSANDLVRDMLTRFAGEIGADVERLLHGETVEQVIDDNVALPDLENSSDVVWSLLTFSGYLTPVTAELAVGGFKATLRIPNREVRGIYEEVFARLLTDAVGRTGVQRLAKQLLAGDAEAAEADLEDALLALSHHDFSRKPVEAVYQAFIVGLLVHLRETHRVTSNREAGHGRADVLVIPRTPGAGAVLELKIVGRRETPEQAMSRALDQLRDRDYAREVRADGATEVHQFGVVFDGKRCWVESLS